jgi:hypothetical protein
MTKADVVDKNKPGVLMFVVLDGLAHVVPVQPGRTYKELSF